MTPCSSNCWSLHRSQGGSQDGALWVVEDRIDRFDGSTWQQLLPGHTLGGWDIAPDGSVWLLANGPYGQGLYVITPEAVAEY